MNIEKVEIRKVNVNKLLAFATVYFENGLMVDDFAIIGGSKGVFVSWPSKKLTDKEGNASYKPLVSMSDREVAKEINDEILRAYRNAPASTETAQPTATKAASKPSATTRRPKTAPTELSDEEKELFGG